ncbi:SDR family NAD(P)-dependent oxidoreductase [Actinosynnema sp. NPDC020468]|uniref:SDR family NAD(P)-dependent oxidoreductase n=1 Tax=Actinosynnema sp. NPDC020468 TaxID=3154488 RepID=UPI0033F4DD79
MSEPSYIDTPFTGESTAAEVVEGIDLTGRRVVVTGGASGIGVETARALAGAGAEVTLAVRDPVAGERTAADIESTTGRRVHVAPLDLADLASVRAFAAAWEGPLHVLVNNAGVMASPETRTPQGWELQFATNHLGHFALATGLYPALAAAGDARVVSVSSSAHLRSPVVFEDIHFHRRPYDPWLAYGQSKTANILFAIEATKRWAAAGITANSLMPGSIRTNLQRHVTEAELDRLRAALKSTTQPKTPQQGAATTVLLATSPLLADTGGHYFEDCAEARPTTPTAPNRGVAPWALDPDAATRLWEVSEQTLNS